MGISKTGFFTEEQNELANKFNSKKTFIHVGIGGSALGPEMLIEALGIPSNRKFLFLNNNSSPTQ